VRFRDEIVAETPRTAKVVSIPRACNEAMGQAGRPCRYTWSTRTDVPAPHAGPGGSVTSGPGGGRRTAGVGAWWI